ncbi:hypothetical protein [Actinophytocola algeriensis]|uniref:Uncharacterized protein n=1 Tax=Actinophytocola algeriensis TaxID=1768010 RepID=A0A7W7Q9E9_9PSEU|nr:hypothetical protein [Actinophytocola algeriensis]MBB4909041.1 hypothetical protein [Actinophytocola algeriensis]MBE1474571.1 hypothetical protein [Actinophytocola algeriensis]
MKWWIVVLVLGVLLTASGTGIGRSDGSPGEITCGGDVMRPGDVCEETQRGVVTDTYTYGEKVRDEKADAEAFARTGRWVQLGLGAGLVLIAVAGIVLTKRRRARQPPTSADLHLRQQVREQHPWPDAPLPHWPPPPQQQYRPPHPQQYPPHPPQYPPQQQQQQYPDFGPRG